MTSLGVPLAQLRPSASRIQRRASSIFGGTSVDEPYDFPPLSSEAMLKSRPGLLQQSQGTVPALHKIMGSIGSIVMTKAVGRYCN